MGDKMRKKITNFRLGELMQDVRRNESEGWECASKLQKETTYNGLTKYFFVMEKDHVKPKPKRVKSREEAAEERNEFAFYLKSNREALGLNQKEMAKALGIPVGTYRPYEYGQRIPKEIDDFMDKFRKTVKDLRS